jgi:uncharacterized membrane protein HdeD (DUF308 family)
MRMSIVDVGTLAQNWWALLIRGIAAVIFGVLTLLAPGISLVTLVVLFGAYAFADGIFAIVMAIRQRGGRNPRWVLWLQGVAGLGAALVTWFYPGLTAVALLFLVAGWAVVTGVLEIVLAIRLRKVISGEWLLVLSGVLSVALGVVLALFPAPGIIALVLWIGAYAIVFGALLTGLSFRLRTWGRHERMEGLPTGHRERPASA